MSNPKRFYVVDACSYDRNRGGLGWYYVLSRRTDPPVPITKRVKYKVAVEIARHFNQYLAEREASPRVKR